MHIRRSGRSRQNDRHGFRRGRTENSRFHARDQRKTGGRLGRSRKLFKIDKIMERQPENRNFHLIFGIFELKKIRELVNRELDNPRISAP